jgi:hypothetical protein
VHYRSLRNLLSYVRWDSDQIVICNLAVKFQRLYYSGPRYHEVLSIGSVVRNLTPGPATGCYGTSITGACQNAAFCPPVSSTVT